MRNEKGLSLIEVLGSIVVLGIAVLGIAFILQQGASHSKSNEKLDQSVQLSRNVIEEIKGKLNSQSSTVLYGQAVSLSTLRNSSSATLPVIYYPNSSEQERKYKIQIQSVGHSLGQVEIKNGTHEGVPHTATYNTGDFIRHVRVTCTELTTLREFTLDAYIPYS
ncbi:prepilin-type N-terminal cleavage/methylation domain-containing protein [Paenibacillus sp. NPDC058174]|uniref:type IV pilus modification PilV family protein n=1 Tax=Paenibacillus sp. NPDC058174 TaxID=3346366 RepID=UPI0036D99371